MATKKTTPKVKATPKARVAAPAVPKSLKGSTVVVTGKLRYGSRADAEALLKKLGATTSGSVSKKTSILLAGGAAGSKLYDADDLGVPILGEGHLQLLVAGRSRDEVIQLARTFYTPKFHPEPGEEALLVGGASHTGGSPLGVEAARWPTHGGKPMRHLLCLDLTALPALQAHYPEQRALSLFASTTHPVDMYEIAQPKNSLVAIRFSTQTQIDAAPAAPPEVESDPEAPIRFLSRTWSEREAHLSRPRLLGGVPFWCQQQEHQGNFIAQLGEESGISGDGLVYLFDDTVFAQFT